MPKTQVIPLPQQDQQPDARTRRAMLEAARDQQRALGYQAEIDLAVFEAQVTANALRSADRVGVDGGGATTVEQHQRDLRGRARGHYEAARRLDALLASLPAPEKEDGDGD